MNPEPRWLLMVETIYLTYQSSPTSTGWHFQPAARLTSFEWQVVGMGRTLESSAWTLPNCVIFTIWSNEQTGIIFRPIWNALRFVAIISFYFEEIAIVWALVASCRHYGVNWSSRGTWATVTLKSTRLTYLQKARMLQVQGQIILGYP